MPFRASHRSVRDHRVQQHVQLENQTDVVDSAKYGMTWTQQAPEQDQTSSQAVQKSTKNPIMVYIQELSNCVATDFEALRQSSKTIPSLICTTDTFTHIF